MNGQRTHTERRKVLIKENNVIEECKQYIMYFTSIVSIDESPRHKLESYNYVFAFCLFKLD